MVSPLSTMSEERIVFLDRETFAPEVALGRPAAAHSWTEHARSGPSEIPDRIRDATIIITNKAPLRAADLAAAPNVKMISVAATGVDVVDLDACRARGVTVCNVRGYATATVPEHTFALMLALRRSVAAYHASVRAGRWREAGQFCYFDYPIQDLRGAVLGIIGDGVLGRAVADIARGFGMEPRFSAHKGVDGMGPLYTPFERILSESDVITLHCPLTPATRHLIGGPEFAQMTRRPLLLNTSRGGLVDEAALAAALTQGQIAGAGFDVTTAEPMPAGHPFEALLDRPDFLLTPHVAWASREAMREVARQTIEAIDAFLDGAPVRVVA